MAAGAAAAAAVTVGAASLWTLAAEPFNIQVEVPESAPAVGTKLPIRATYVVVGAGTAAYEAVSAIKNVQPKAKVLVVGDEPYVPYQRPPLTKELWFSDDPAVAETLAFVDWQGNKAELQYKPREAYRIIGDNEVVTAVGEDGDDRINIILGRKAVAVDSEQRKVTLDNGQDIIYDKLLIATGGRPKQLPFVRTAPASLQQHVTTYRNINDFKALDQVVRTKKHIAVIGGGFLGSELACSLAHRAGTGPDKQLQVTQIFPEDGNMGLVLPRYLSSWTTNKMRSLGIDVKNKMSVQSMSEAADKDGNAKVVLTLTDGSELVVDHVVVAVGLDPNVELAKSAQLETDAVRGGIMANAELEAHSNIWVAGDVSSYHDVTLGRRRVEHYDHAVLSGRAAGLNMTGAKRPYSHQSMFWSNLGPNIAYEAVGLVDSSLVTVGVWAKASEDAPTGEYGKGVVYYLKDKHVVGVLMWNVFDKVPVARKIIRQPKAIENYNELQSLIRVA